MKTIIVKNEAGEIVKEFEGESVITLSSIGEEISVGGVYTPEEGGIKLLGMAIAFIETIAKLTNMTFDETVKIISRCGEGCIKEESECTSTKESSKG